VRKKQFKNPDLLEQLIQKNNLVEIGSNFSGQVFDPFQWGEPSFYDDLAREQLKHIDEEKKIQQRIRTKDKHKILHPREEEEDRETKRRRSS